MGWFGLEKVQAQGEITSAFHELDSACREGREGFFSEVYS